MTVMPRFLTGTPGLIAAFAAAALCGASAAVSAEGLPAADEGSRWSLSGFGTLGAVWHDEDDTQFRRSVDQHRGTRANELDFGIDSTLGVQVHGALTPQWSLMAQAVMNQGRHGEWGPHLVWGFVKYVPSDGLELRAGRLVTDIYFDGDSRHVGYAYTAVRPYADVYGRLTYDNFDGLDATVQHALGEGLLRFKLFGGRTRGSVFLNEREHPLRIGRTFGATLDWIGPELSLKLSWGNMVSTRNGIYWDRCVRCCKAWRKGRKRWAITGSPRKHRRSHRRSSIRTGSATWGLRSPGSGGRSRCSSWAPICR
jgi:hypothetical protein